MERQFRKVNRSGSDQIRALRQEFRKESGLFSRIMPAILGPVFSGPPAAKSAAWRAEDI